MCARGEQTAVSGQAVETGAASTIVVAKLDRLSRSLVTSLP
jgi:DNA invertase Pin-like site-specific DNA recombinase